jgi:adenosylcobinamide-GDP ribazoletransferase
MTFPGCSNRPRSPRRTIDMHVLPKLRRRAVPALFAAPVTSRFAPLLAAHWVDREGHVDGATVRIAALWCVLPLLLMVLAEGVVFLVLALLLAAIAWVAMLRFFRNRPARFGEERAAGVQQVCEAAFYLGAAIGA